jgi:hypothetical protein
MGLFKKEEDFYHRQLRIWEKKAEEADIGSTDYDDAMSNIATIHRYIKEQKEGEKIDTSVLDVAVKAAGTVVTLGLGVANIVMFGKTAKLAYKKESDMEVSNQKVWNLKDKFKS